MVKIYCLVDPRNNRPFYVGATINSLKGRLYQHMNDTKMYRDYWPNEWRRREPAFKKGHLIQSLIKEGLQPRVDLLFIATEKTVDHYERLFFDILSAQGFDLHQLSSRFVYQNQTKCYKEWAKNKPHLMPLTKILPI